MALSSASGSVGCSPDRMKKNLAELPAMYWRIVANIYTEPPGPQLSPYGELAVETFKGFQDKDQNPDQQKTSGQRQAASWKTPYRLYSRPDGQNHDQSRGPEGDATSPVSWPCWNYCGEAGPQLCCRGSRDEDASYHYREA